MSIQAGIKVAQTVYKYRKFIYRTLVAQDRAIGKTWTYGGYSKWTSAGIRHGAFIGSIVGTLIAPDSPGNDNGIPQIQPRKLPTTSKSYKTRSRQSVYCRPEYKRRYNSRFR